jgi:hypothetical protein
MNKTPKEQHIARREKVRNIIEKAISKVMELPDGKVVNGQVVKLGRTLAVRLKGGKLYMLELDRLGCNGQVSGVGEFGLNVFGRSIVDVLFELGELSLGEANEAERMISEHEVSAKTESDVHRLHDLARQYGYTLTKQKKED